MAKENNTMFKTLLAAALAWLIPGAGHVFIGSRVKGAIIFVVIAATFWSGILMGGVMTVDRQAEPMWFVAEMLTGGHGLTAWRWQQSVMKKIDKDIGPVTSAQQYRDLRDEQLARRGLALVSPVEVIARAYSGVAGMLNLLCIFDVVMLVMMRTRQKVVRR
ncbi:MAG: hypothetical protein GXY38_04300 [Planctomycetes bacterium]|nr:hypothetical protein [Planctomycetota bacterium]